jgi:hypothetical protein
VRIKHCGRMIHATWNFNQVHPWPSRRHAQKKRHRYGFFPRPHRHRHWHRHWHCHRRGHGQRKKTFVPIITYQPPHTHRHSLLAYVHNVGCELSIIELIRPWRLHRFLRNPG